MSSNGHPGSGTTSRAQLEAEVERWKARSRRFEREAKENFAAAKSLEMMKRKGASTMDQGTNRTTPDTPNE